jgi:hypothetical protein
MGGASANGNASGNSPNNQNFAGGMPYRANSSASPYGLGAGSNNYFGQGGRGGWNGGNYGQGQNQGWNQNAYSTGQGNNQGNYNQSNNGYGGGW